MLPDYCTGSFQKLEGRRDAERNWYIFSQFMILDAINPYRDWDGTVSVGPVHASDAEASLSSESSKKTNSDWEIRKNRVTIVDGNVTCTRDDYKVIWADISDGPQVIKTRFVDDRHEIIYEDDSELPAEKYRSLPELSLIHI